MFRHASRGNVLGQILQHYASTPELAGRLVLQGSGALHYCYGSPRQPSDLDFVCPSGLDGVADALMRPVRIENAFVMPTHRRISDRFLRVKYGTGTLVGKVEVYALEACEPVPAAGYGPLRVESRREIAADKIVATVARARTRGSIKPTDLYDLEWLDADAPPEMIAGKAAAYGETFDRHGIAQVIRMLLTSTEQERMSAQLRRDLPAAAHPLLTRAFYECAAQRFLRAMPR